MTKIDILSKRRYTTWPSWHIVYEWEDDFSRVLNIPIKSSFLLERVLDNKYSRQLLSTPTFKEIFQKINSFFGSANKSIVFELSYKNNISYSNGVNSIPIIIDFYSKNVDLFNLTYINSKLICITSLEVFEFLKKNNCPLNIKHLPLSLSDRYRDINITLPRKYDIIFAGRRNHILWSYLKEFEVRHPDIEYLFQEEIKGKLYYKSNKDGIIGSFHTRAEYMDLLKTCKIAFYSTPGIDGGEDRTQGFNQVTPRFLELIASGCNVMGRYPDNEETRFYEMGNLCPNIETYEQFEEVLTSYLSSGVPAEDSIRGFMSKHYTSKRAELLDSYIKETF